MNMPNNLDESIKRSGKSKRDVARMADVTPETLSRHIHGKIKLTMEMAELYSKVLDCEPYDILFAARPIPIIGHCHLNADNTISREIAVKKRLGKVYMHNYQQQDTAAIIWSADDEYDGKHNMFRNAVEFVQYSPVKNNLVSKDCFQNDSYVCFDGPQEGISDIESNDRLFSGFVYPQPRGLYSVYNPYMDRLIENVKLRWATPSLAAAFRPDLRDIKIIYDK